MARRKERNLAQDPPPGGWRYVAPDDPEAFPRVVVFDLDYTCWDLFCDTHPTPPFKRAGSDVNRLVDRRGYHIEFYRELPQILAELKGRDTHIAIASRTGAIDIAREMLALLHLHDVDGTPIPAVKYFNQIEIYPSSKIKHFGCIHKKTGIPYEQMVFFDDEHRNFEVEDLGVTMQLVRNGVTRQCYHEGLDLWRRRRGIRIQH